jgi:glycosyltransferase involved in cell wall biosynthesis
MRMKVLEAMARGKAVITTALGAEGITGFGEEAPLVLAEETESIAAAAASLLTYRARRLELGLRARAFAERHHSPAAWARRLEAVYEEARAGHRAPSAAAEAPVKVRRAGSR